MKLSLILFIICESVAFVCICCGAVFIYKVHKKEKEQTEKKRIQDYLFLSTSWLMWADLCGIKISSIASKEESRHGFYVLFSKRSSDKIESLLLFHTLLDMLKGNFEKLDNGRYRFVSTSLAESLKDIEILMQYCSTLLSYTTEIGGTECQDKHTQ